MTKTLKWIAFGILIVQTGLFGCSKRLERQEAERSSVADGFETKASSPVDMVLTRVEKVKCLELVKCTQTALVLLYDEMGLWPQGLLANSGAERGLDATAAYPLRTMMNLKHDAEEKRLIGSDRFGIVTPWAAKVIHGRRGSCTERDAVPGGGTVADHRLRYALSVEGTGTIRDIPIREKVDGRWRERRVTVRAMAAVWCLAPDGSLIKSWSDGQVE